MLRQPLLAASSASASASLCCQRAAARAPLLSSLAPALAASAAARHSSSLSVDTPKAAPAPAGPRLPAPSLSLADLRDNPGATKPRFRKGRGHASGMGKTAGRGSKGNTARSGGAVALGFEGGQTPLWRRSPKVSHINAFFQAPLEVVNLGQLQTWIDQGRINPAARITMRTLVDSGLVSSCQYGVKLLGDGASRFAARVDIEVSQASGEAIAAVEAAGGKIKSVYYSPLALRAHLAPHKFALPLMAPKPPPKKMGYYTAYANRGYLSPEVQLAELKERLAAGASPEAAAALMPVYVGGPVTVGPRLQAVAPGPWVELDAAREAGAAALK